MAKRRLQFTGGTSYTVTLPKEWVLSNGLEKNDPVFMDALADGTLIVRPVESQPASVKKVKVIPTDGLDPVTLERRLLGSYVSGYAEIELTAGDAIPEKISVIAKEFARSVVGLGVIEDDEKHLVIKDFTYLAELSPMHNVSRMKVIVRNILSDISNSMLLGSHMGTLQNRDSEVDRIRLLILRQTNILHTEPTFYPSVNLSPRELDTINRLAAIMEDIGDTCVSMNDALQTMNNRGAIEDLAVVMEDVGVTELFVKAVDAALNRDLPAAERCIAVTTTANSKMMNSRELSRRYDVLDALAANTISVSISKILEYITDISEVAIDVSMAE